MNSIYKRNLLKLRNETNAGFDQCKKALERSGNNYNAAYKLILDELAILKNKRKNRKTDNGRVFYLNKNGTHILLELLCESYSVSINDIFKNLGLEICEAYISNSDEVVEDLVPEKLNRAMAVIKENILIDKKVVWKDTDEYKIFGMLHHNYKSGVMVKFLHNSSYNDDISNRMCLNLIHYNSSSIEDFLKEKDIFNQEYSVGKYLESIDASLKIMDFCISRVTVK